jgi:phosphate transport system substrate-binding protein
MLRPAPLAFAAVRIAMGGLLAAACSVGAVPGKESSIKPVRSLPPGAVSIRGAGATFPSVLYDEWFRRYQDAHPAAAIAYDAVGSGEGIRRFIGRGVKDDDRVDFGASDAAMRDDEIGMVPQGAVLVPVTAGSVVLAYELPDVPAGLKLSREAYVGIFMGAVKNWNDPRIARVNPGVKLPNLTITTVVRQDSSGTTFAFTKHLDAVSNAWRANFGPSTLVNWPGNSMRAVGNEGVAARIKQSEGAVGYLSYEFARRIGLKIALLENHAGTFVGPTEGASSAALVEAELPANMRVYVPDPSGRDAYPLVTLTWVLLYRTYTDARKAEELHDLFRWCLTDGQQLAAGLGYVPLPPAIVQRSLAALEDVRVSH